MPFKPGFDLCANRIASCLSGEAIANPDAFTRAFGSALLRGVKNPYECMGRLPDSEDGASRFQVACGVGGCAIRRTLTERNGSFLMQQNSPETAVDICRALYH